MDASENPTACPATFPVWYSMEINGKATVADYGNIIQQNHTPFKKLPMLHQWVDGVSGGVKTMEVQAHIYSFLLKVCLI
jgi:hypothetical protein